MDLSRESQKNIVRLACVAAIATACTSSAPVATSAERVLPPLLVVDASTYSVVARDSRTSGSDAGPPPVAEISCDPSDMLGCTKLAETLDLGKNRDKDRVAASRLFERACDGRSMRACVLLGQHWAAGEGGRSRDETMAASLYERACKGGYAFGCTSLAMAYRHGVGVTVDFPKSLTLLEMACAHNDPSGCTQLGYVFDVGVGGAKVDVTQATTFYQKACDGNEGQACANLASIYAFGAGPVARDEAKAATLRRRACNLGNAAACAARVE